MKGNKKRADSTSFRSAIHATDSTRKGMDGEQQADEQAREILSGQTVDQRKYQKAIYAMQQQIGAMID